MTSAVRPAPIEHHLKIWPEPFAAVRRGDKRFEWRHDDRGFQAGDALLLREYEPTPALRDLVGAGADGFTGRALRVTITYVLRGPYFGVPQGFAVLSIANVLEVVYP